MTNLASFCIFSIPSSLSIPFEMDGCDCTDSDHTEENLVSELKYDVYRVTSGDFNNDLTIQFASDPEWLVLLFADENKPSRDKRWIYSLTETHSIRRMGSKKATAAIERCDPSNPIARVRSLIWIIGNHHLEVCQYNAIAEMINAALDELHPPHAADDEPSDDYRIEWNIEEELFCIVQSELPWHEKITELRCLHEKASRFKSLRKRISNAIRQVFTEGRIADRREDTETRRASHNERSKMKWRRFSIVLRETHVEMNAIRRKKRDLPEVLRSKRHYQKRRELMPSAYRSA
jgi:hypothetical protein